MKKTYILVCLMIALVTGCASTGSDPVASDKYMEMSKDTEAPATSYPQDASPDRDDEALAINNPDGTWNITRVPYSSILELLEDSDIPQSIARDSELPDVSGLSDEIEALSDTVTNHEDEISDLADDIETLNDSIANQVVVNTYTYRKDNLAAADDDYEFFIANLPMTIESFGVHCSGTCTTTAEISLEDRGGTAMNHSVIEASTGTEQTRIYSVTGANTLATGEGLCFDVDNTPVPETDSYTLMVTYRIPELNYDYMPFSQIGDANLDFTLSLPAASSVEIVWGDGDITTVNGPVSSQNFAHTYPTSNTYNGMIRYDLDDITYFHAANETGLTINLAELPSGLNGILNLDNTLAYGDATALSQNITDLHLRNTAASGSLAALPHVVSVLDIEGTQVTGDIGDLWSGLAGSFLASNTAIGGDIADLPSTITGNVDISNTSVNTYTSGTWPMQTASGKTISFADLGLDATEVNNILIDLNTYADANSITGGTLDLTGNDSRTTDSDTAYGNLAYVLGWTIGEPTQEMAFTQDGSVDLTLGFTVSLPSGSEIEIDWGDSTSTTVTGPVTETLYEHTYSTATTYSGTITGDWHSVTYLAANGETGLSLDAGDLPSGLTDLLGLVGVTFTGGSTLADLPRSLTGGLAINSTNIGGSVTGLPSGLVSFVNLKDTSVTGAASDFSISPTSVLNLEGTAITGDIADLPASLATSIFLSGCGIDDYTGGSWPFNTGNGAILTFDNLGLDATEVDNILIDLAAHGATGGNINLTGNANRTSSSDAAYTALTTTLGWTVSVGTSASANTYYVADGLDGDGSESSPYSTAQFEALTGDYSGDIFYFTGTITEDSLDVNIYGTSGNPVTLDGWSGGTCEPVVSTCSSSAYMGATLLNIGGNDHIRIQDLRWAANYTRAIQSTNAVPVDGIEVRRCELHRSTLGSIYLPYANDALIYYNNIDSDNTSGVGHNIEIRAGKNNRIVRNTIDGGFVGLILKSGATVGGGGITGNGSVLENNIVVCNTITYPREEGASYDAVYNSTPDVTTFDRDVISAVGTNTIELAHANWDSTSTDFSGYYMVFLTGSLIGETYEIQAHAYDDFTFTENVSAASAGDEVAICAPAINLYFGFNTITHTWNSCPLVFGSAYRVMFEGNTTLGAGSMTMQHAFTGYPSDYSVTGNCSFGVPYNGLFYNNNSINDLNAFVYNPGNCSDSYGVTLMHKIEFYSNTVSDRIYVDNVNYYAHDNSAGGGIVEGWAATNNASFGVDWPYITAVSINGSSVSVTWSQSVDTTSYNTGDLFLYYDWDIDTPINLSSPSGSGATRTFTAATAATNGQTVHINYPARGTIVDATDGDDMIVTGFKTVTNATP